MHERQSVARCIDTSVYLQRPPNSNRSKDICNNEGAGKRSAPPKLDNALMHVHNKVNIAAALGNSEDTRKLACIDRRFKDHCNMMGAAPTGIQLRRRRTALHHELELDHPDDSTSTHDDDHTPYHNRINISGNYVNLQYSPPHRRQAEGAGRSGDHDSFEEAIIGQNIKSRIRPPSAMQVEQSDGENRSPPFMPNLSTPKFSVHIEEVKSLRRKTWRFPHAASSSKDSERAIVLFPNPTFDENFTISGISTSSNCSRHCSTSNCRRAADADGAGREITTLEKAFHERSTAASSSTVESSSHPKLEAEVTMNYVNEKSCSRELPLYSALELKREMAVRCLSQESTHLSSVCFMEELVTTANTRGASCDKAHQLAGIMAGSCAAIQQPKDCPPACGEDMGINSKYTGTTLMGHQDRASSGNSSCNSSSSTSTITTTAATNSDSRSSSSSSSRGRGGGSCKFMRPARLNVHNWLLRFRSARPSKSPTLIRKLPSFHEMEDIRL